MKVFVLCLAFALSSAFDYTTEWEMWKMEHGKSYASNDEEIFRHTIFEANKKYVDEHNANAARWGYTLATNKFADMDAAEFSRIYNGYLGHEKRSNFTRKFVPTTNDIPTTMDWREKGAVTGVKNQGQCGSCWSFSATGSLEGQHFIKTGTLVSLSEQQLVDCSTSYGNHGCQGGLMDYAFKYIKENGGDDTEASYPYKAENGKCQFNPSTVGATDSGYVDIPSKDCDALKNACGSIGPISVAMDASHMSFQLYHSGVYEPLICSSTNLDHGVLVVGYGTEDGKDYFLVKNSWGTTWGIQGYFKIINKNNKCGLCTDASYPTV